jgi:multisubunit Na+/H+ antiporter MnhE subunit
VWRKLAVSVAKMFELLDEKKQLVSRRVAVCGVLTGAFSLGLLAGLFLARALPFDLMRIVVLVFFLVWTVWWAVVAFRRDTATRNEDQSPAVSKAR